MKVAVNSDNHSVGYAWAAVETQEQAESAIAALSGTLEVGGVRVTLAPVTDKRDMLFSKLTHAQRLALRLDSVALYSVTDQHDADRVSLLIGALAACAVPPLCPEAKAAPGAPPQSADSTFDGDAPVVSHPQPPTRTTTDLSVLDAFACVGGNTISFAQHFRHVVAVELDVDRHAMLAHNVAVAIGADVARARVRTICGDAHGALVECACDAVFLDPPWGGPGYTADACLTEFDMGAEVGGMRALFRDSAACAELCVARLPTNFGIDGLAQWLVSPGAIPPFPGADPNERPLPFRLRLGHKATLLVVCFQATRARVHGIASSEGARAGAGSRLRFGLHNLDALVAALVGFDRAWACEHHPAFFDWEAQRWIRLKDWKGCKMPAVPPGPESAI